VFTGIIEHLGRVTGVDQGRGATVLTVGPDPPFEAVQPGESISVDGACLTVTQVVGDELSFDVVAETLSRSTLGDRRAGDLVNLERSLRLGDLVGGHLVLGHVDGVGRISALRPVGGQVEMAVEVPGELSELMLPKGSVAVDGISLTVLEVRPGRFSVALVPYTRQHTGLRQKREGDAVNIETDYLGKWVLRALCDRGVEGVTRELLERTGFLEPEAGQ